MKKWLVAETIVLTFVPTVLLLEGLSLLPLGVATIIFSRESDTREWYGLLGLLPLAGGMFGLLTVWRYVLALSRNRKFPLDGWFIAAAIGGGLASWPWIYIAYVGPSADRLWSVVICAPIWLLVGHLLYLRGANDGTPTNARHENKGPALKKWLIAETVVLTLLPTAFLLYELSFLLSSLKAILFPMASDTREWYERLFNLLPTLGGMFGLLTVWRYALSLSRHRSFPLDWWFIAAAIGGGLASWRLIWMIYMLPSADILSSACRLSGVLICAPVWLLVGHLLYLRGVLRRHADPTGR